MKKKLTESKINYAKQLIFESQVDDLVNNSSFIEKVADKVLSNSKNKKEMEKNVREIVAKCMNSLFKSMWMKKEYYENDIKNGY